MTSPETSSNPKRAPLWMKIAFAASLAVNLLIAGIVVGALLSPHGPREKRIEQAGRDVGASPFFRALEPQDRRAVFQALRQQQEPLRQNREELQLRFEALLAALRADPFDPDEVRSLLALQRSAAVGRQEIGETVLTERLAAMTPDQRAAFADRLEEVLRRPKPPGRDR